MLIPQQGQCVLRNHTFFIGRHDIDRNFAVRAGYKRAVARVLDRIKRALQAIRAVPKSSPECQRNFLRSPR